MRYTEDRTHWAQSMTDIRIRPNLSGLNEKEKEIAEHIYDIIPHYRAAAKVLARGEIYRRSSPMGGHRDLDGNKWALYWWDENKKELITIAHNITPHRGAQVMRRGWEDYRRGIIDPEIWGNYITNGYNTRRGLYSNYNPEKKEKIKSISRSHADIMIEGKEGHDMRVRARL